jgi:hypothetical protein
LALGGRQSIKTPNNQPRVGRSGRGYVIAEAGGGGSTVGDTVQLFGAANGTTTKMYNNKYIVTFGSLRSKMITQQPTKNGREWGRRGWTRGTYVGEWQRDANAPRLHVEGERG